jgi:hypothetical protein
MARSDRLEQPSKVTVSAFALQLVILLDQSHAGTAQLREMGLAEFFNLVRKVDFSEARPVATDASLAEATPPIAALAISEPVPSLTVKSVPSLLQAKYVTMGKSKISLADEHLFIFNIILGCTNAVSKGYAQLTLF